LSAVETIDLAYVGRGLHEELVAHVADQEGYFEDEGVHVAIRDGVSWPAERLRRGAVIGLGRTLVSRLKDGIEWTAVSFSTDHPLFWFLGNAEVKSMADLRGRRLAVHGPSDPPGTFARIVLRKHGLDPDKDLECIVGHPGDYQMDLRRLRDGSIDAAYVGSTLSPEQVAAEEGFHVLAWVGDHFQIPTVGVVVDPTHIPLDSPALQALARANERALQLLVPGPTHARGSTTVLRRLCRAVLRPRPDGRSRHGATGHRRRRRRARHRTCRGGGDVWARREVDRKHLSDSFQARRIVCPDCICR
jgi:ABC-type nitrate/sulfonate/bicarbonate transport system substrate-binding protein